MSGKMNFRVVCFTGGSGLTHYSVSLARELARYGTVQLDTATSFALHAISGDFQVNRVFRRSRQYPVDVLRFFLQILRSRPDVVLFQSWLKYPLLEGLMVRLFSLAGIRTALTIHDLLPHYPKPWSRWLHAWYYRQFDKLIVHSARSAEALKGLGVNTQPLVVPHGVYDIFRLGDLSREQVLPRFPNVNPGDFVVLYFGHIETRKGILEFLQASDRLVGQRKIKFLIAGKNDLNGEAAAQLESFRGRPNLTIDDRLIPFEEVQFYFACADIVALPYREGTTSGVMKLAMAFGRPVIASDVGDLREMLQDWPGCLIPVEDMAESLTQEIVTAQRDYASMLKDAVQGTGKYSWQTIGQAYFDYLSNVKNR